MSPNAATPSSGANACVPAMARSSPSTHAPAYRPVSIWARAKKFPGVFVIEALFRYVSFEIGPSDGMVFGMATTKITITLHDDQVKEIHALVAAGRSASVSAFVQHAVAVALSDAAGWKEMLEDALRQTGGPLTTKERAWADEVLRPRKEKRRAGRGRAA